MPKQIPEDIRAISRERAPQFYKMSKKTLQPRTVEIGQIWSTYSSSGVMGSDQLSTNEPRLIVILAGSGNIDEKMDQVNAVPISLLTWAATDLDLVIKSQNSPLNYDFMVEVWNETPVLKRQLRICLGYLPTQIISMLKAIHIARLVGEDVPEITRGWVGLPLIGSEDVRHAFQRAEIEALEYLAKPATHVVFSELSEVVDTVNPVQNKRRYSVQPIFGNLENFLGNRKRALASSSASRNSVIIASGEDSHDFVFELLERHRESLVYLMTHELSPALDGKTCTVTLITENETVVSSSALMNKGVEIPIGRIHDFDKNQVVRVEIEVN